MNNIDLIKILKDCPEGTKFYSSIYGELMYSYTYISPSATKFVFILPNSNSMFDNTPMKIEYYWNGKYVNNMGECTLFPSKEQRDWSKFTASWYKKERFDPKTLQPFDKILVKRYDNIWVATLLSHSETHTYGLGISYLEFTTINNGIYESCIPYNEDTKHLVGTSDEAPEYYRYWER